MAIIRAGDARAKAREWRVQTRLKRRFEATLRRRMGAAFKQAARDAADAYRAGGPGVIDLALRDHAVDVERGLFAVYDGVMQAFGGRFIRDAGKSLVVPERRDTQDSFDALVRRWIDEIGAGKVVRIADTTRRQIIDVILAGEAEGLGVDAIARSIVDKTGGLIGRLRAAIIARTETHSASQAAQAQALDVLDIPRVRREWVAAEDGRTRDSHLRADGQIRGQAEAFDVGAAKLMHPGDPAGPPAEIIQCRCIAASVVED